jgi:RHS repeat-associated protein
MKDKVSNGKAKGGSYWWEETEVAVGFGLVGPYSGISVSPLCHVWAKNETSIGVTVQIDGVGGFPIGTMTRADQESHQDDIDPIQCTCPGSVWSGCDGGCGSDSSSSCPNGSCSGSVGMEGPRLGSVDFRIPFGSVGYNAIAGMLWFSVKDNSVLLNQELLSVISNSSVAVSCYPSGGVSNIVCEAAGVNGITVLSFCRGGTNGLSLQVYDTTEPGQVPARVWEITDEGMRDYEGRTSTVRFRKLVGASVDRDSIFEYTGGRWRQTDLITGVTQTVNPVGDPEQGWDETTRCMWHVADPGKIISERTVRREKIGPVYRECVIKEKVGYTDVWRTTTNAYWVSEDYPALNGCPKFRYSDFNGDWEYRAYDTRGRETLRAEPLDGSTPPPFATSGTPATLASFTAGGLTAAVTVTGYEGAESESFLDVGKPRKVERYRVLEGVATKISCEWHTYTRELAPDGLGALRHRVIRACSQAAAQGDSANAWTETLEYDGDSRDKADTPPPLLRGKLLEETRFEGGVKAVTKSEYLLDTNENRCYVTTWKGTDTLENGVAGRSTFETVTLDAFTGLELGRETRLRVSSGDAPLLWEEARTYDAKGRLVATLYSDGTFESNDWSCCSLQAKIGRDGARTDLMYLPGYSGESLSEETSMGGLPGANGRHPAVVTLVDALGRVTNSVRKVMVNGNDDPNYAWLVTRTEYPDGTEDYKVTIGPLGVVTVSRRYFEVGCEIEETFSSGVTTRVTRVNGGSTVAERFWDGKWTKETQSSSTSDSGRRVDTVTIEASDIPEAVMTSETVYDYLGRPVVVTTPLGITSNFYDGASDTLVRVSQTGSPDTLYVYDELGNVLDTVLDVDGDGAADYDGTDRITRTRTGYQLSGASWWLVTSNEVWNADGVNAPLLVSTSSTRLTGLGSAANGVSGVPDGAILTSQGEAKSCQHKPYAFLYGPTMRTYTYTDRASATAWQVTDTPESSQNAVRVMVAGYAVSDISASSIPTAYTYDGFSRQTAVTDGRSNTTFTAYSALGLPEYTEDAASNLTSYTYDSFGRRTAVTNALGQATYTAYDPLGRVIATWGATYPVAYEYDTAGRMVAMATTRDSAQSSVNLLTLLPSGVALSDTSHASYPDQLDTTKWLYDQTTGLLTNKVYADGTGTAYSYTSAGRLATRTWARGVTTAYTYDSLGQLTTVDYSDATPDVTYTYDRLGRKTSAVSSVSAVSYTYSGPDLVSETQNGETLARTHDGLGRVETMNYIPQGLLYGYYEELRLYDDYGRLSSIHARSPHNTALSGTTPYDASFEYAYLPGTDIPQSMTAWHLSDYLDEYGNWVPQADQTLAWTRSYDPARNLITGVENRFGGQPVSSFTYVNDAIGRRTQRTDFDGSVYTANAFSYNARSEVAMAQMGNNTYTYNYDPIGNRRFALANGARTDYAANSLNQYTGITGGSVSSPTYDADGNMLTCTLSTGTWYFFWDGENRLICVSNMATVVSNAYDHHSRRIRKEVYVRESPSFEFQFSRSHSFLWDGWNPLCESVTPGSGWMNPADVYSYTWGLDLSGTAQGAGGVCGLLAEYVPFAEMMGFGETYYPAYDANGNITAYLDTTGATAATFEYDAFGNTISEAVSPGLHLPFRFSTKYADAETGLVMYQLRAYSTGLGRWLSRDPIGIRGGFNPCHYVCNSPVNRVDFLGLYGMDVHYYLTYYLAAKCGLTEGTEFGSEADMIAWADQQTDDAVSTQPLTTVSAQRRKFHFRHEKGQRVQRGSDVAKDPAQSGVEAEDPLLFGMGLHALQDSYSHENAKEAHGVPPFFRGDDVSSDVAKSIQMAQEIYDMLDQYRHKKYCKHCDAKFADFASGLRETIRKNRITQDLGDSASGYYKDYLKGYTFFDDRAAGVSDPLGH